MVMTAVTWSILELAWLNARSMGEACADEEHAAANVIKAGAAAYLMCFGIKETTSPNPPAAYLAPASTAFPK